MRELLDQLREDWALHGRAWTHPGFQAVAVYRLGRWMRGQAQPLRFLARLAYAPLYVFVRNVYGIELPAKATIGRRFKISHQSGIVLGERVEIGDDCRIRQNVTIGGLGNLGRGKGHGHPVLGDRVYVAAGAVIIGNVAVGDDAHVGPNALVVSDIPAGATAFARPASVLRPADSGSVTEKADPAEADRAADPAPTPHDST